MSPQWRYSDCLCAMQYLQKLMYCNKEIYDDTLSAIQASWPHFHAYLAKTWLAQKKLFAEAYRTHI